MSGRKEKLFFNFKRGQGVLESCLAALPVFFLLFFSFQFIFVMAGKIYLDHQLYEALLCVSKGVSKETCEWNLRKKSRTFLSAGSKLSVWLDGSTRGGRASALWEVKPWKIQFKKTILIPEDLLR